MPDWVVVLALGVIEGVTEFLPVSSTGHLLMAEHWLGAQSDAFNVMIQSGAVLAVLVIFTSRLRQLVFGWRTAEARAYLGKLGLAFVLTAVGGLVCKKLGLKLPETPVPVAWATLIGGLLFILLERWLCGRPTRDQITWTIALAMASAQLLAAIFPGASRSGTTILLGLGLGASRPAATEFSFLLGIPTLLAAGALELHGALNDPAAPRENWGLLFLGLIASAVTAFLAVKWLLRFVQSHTFEGFGWYRILIGVAILVLVT